MKVKKLLAAILAVAMVLGMMAFPAFADEAEDLNETPETYALSAGRSASVWSGEVDTTWYTEAEEGTTDFIISTSEQLAGLAEIVNGTGSVTDDFSKKTIILANDIDLQNVEWTPIGTSSKPFKGTFDGGGYTIKNLFINKPEQSYIGLFGRTSAVLKKLTLENVNITGYLNVGAVVGEAYTGGPLEDITVTGEIFVTGMAYVGGITGGQYSYVSLINCDVLAAEGSGSRIYADSNTDQAYRSYVGGITGQRGEGNYEVKDCDARIDVTGTVCNIGGISGNQHYGNKFRNCTYEGTLTLENTPEGSTPAATLMGAIAGSVLTATNNTTIMENCTFNGNAMINGVDVSDDLKPAEWYSDSYKDATGVFLTANINGTEKTVTNYTAAIGTNGYETLADALAAAQPKDVVMVFPGTYDEIITIDKAVTLKGAEDVVFSGIIKVTADGAVLDGINLQYEGMRGTTAEDGIYGNVYIQANNVTVRNSSFYAAYDTASPGIGGEFGMVWIPSASENIVFDNCTLQTNTMGIFPAMKTGEIKNCTFKPLDEGDTRKSLAVNYTGMEDVSFANNSFYGVRVYTNNAQFTENKFIGFTGNAVYNRDWGSAAESYYPIDLSYNYFSNPVDVEKNINANIRIFPCYTDEEMTNLTYGYDTTSTDEEKVAALNATSIDDSIAEDVKEVIASVSTEEQKNISPGIVEQIIHVQGTDTSAEGAYSMDTAITVNVASVEDTSDVHDVLKGDGKIVYEVTANEGAETDVEKTSKPVLIKIAAEKPIIKVLHDHAGVVKEIPFQQKDGFVIFTMNEFSNISLVAAVTPAEGQAKLSFVPVSGAEGTAAFDLVLTGDEFNTVKNFVSGEFTTILSGANTSFSYDITPANDEISIYYDTTADGTRTYHVNLKEFFEDSSYTTNEDAGYANSVKIGTMIVSGYGNGTISLKDIKMYKHDGSAENLVKDIPAVPGEAAIFNVAAPAAKLTVNVKFNNPVNNNSKLYQDMTVIISGGDLTENIEYKLGNDTKGVNWNTNTYSISVNLTKEVMYTVTVEGEGYRTARYSVNMNMDKVLNFWNNVKDSAEAVEEGKSGNEVTKNFLAGEIVKDGKINVYDLSAVVSYFGENNLVEDHPEYAKYDLNRDGKIDSKDVAMVLVSWNE